MTNASGGVVNINSGEGGARIFSASLVNQGAFNLNVSAAIGQASTVLLNQGTITIASGQTMNLAGAFTQTAGATILDGATLTAANPLLIQGGSVTGTGTINQSVTSGGTFSPGNSNGVLKVAGAYTQTSAGALNITLGGPAAGTQYSQLLVTGPAQIGGQLRATLTNGFVPTNGSSFVVLSASQVSGKFSSLDLPPLAAGQSWQVDYPSAQIVTLRVTSAGTNNTLTISGTVTNSQGKPVAGAVAYAYIDPLDVTNLIQNGSFETPSQNGTQSIVYPPGSTNIPGWTVLGPGDIEILSAYIGPAEDGLQYFDPSGSGSAPEGGISQAFPTTPGVNYKLIFYNGSYANPGVNGLGVTLNGVSTSFGQTGGGQGNLNWTEQTIPFTATATLTTVSFQNLSGVYAANDNFVDNVQVYPAAYGEMLQGVTDTNGHFQIAVSDGTTASGGGRLGFVGLR